MDLRWLVMAFLFGSRFKAGPPFALTTPADEAGPENQQLRLSPMHPARPKARTGSQRFRDAIFAPHPQNRTSRGEDGPRARHFQAARTRAASARPLGPL